MKKKYVKPYIAVESFQLNAAIASCTSEGGIPINKSENDCGFDTGVDNQFQFFNYINCDVDLTGPEGDGNDTICYHGPTWGFTFIKS